MKTSDVVSEIVGALVLANAELKNPAKDAKGQVRGNRDYTYASLPAIIDDVRPILTRNGLAAVQEDVTTSEGIGVVTRLLHISGQWLEFGPLLMPMTNDAQANGSILTYCRRYQLTAALGLAPDEDDDARSAVAFSGHAASGGSTAKAKSNARPGATSGQAARDAAPPSHQADRTRSDVQLSDQQAQSVPAGEPTHGEGATPAGTSKYLSPDDQQVLGTEYGTKAKALIHYKKRYGNRLNSVADITYEMRDEMEATTR